MGRKSMGGRARATRGTHAGLAELLAGFEAVCGMFRQLTTAQRNAMAAALNGIRVENLTAGWVRANIRRGGPLAQALLLLSCWTRKATADAQEA